ncbi:hypothetical protein P170DRAFT_422647 [Aspergillus steynii IBT 23096]|uniref:Uncharacterized protein n=1 Tax=Aspergillus steynii IBT 23096 TaxID=1392250 RepID=A0A2I2GFQ2_9EURO|nr:uncharacterized protein P170DRAFT_422647 [Aspergillus steynii IBT 23096]PLB51657.1 hypothetical protein P170DRAFT_422647 [Aspergillus steynii IBT 23096]
MRWSQENEQILWRTIFETQDLFIDLEKVANAWPGDEKDKPSVKALCEQLSKYRKASNGTNTVKLSMGGAKRKAADSNTTTPRKRATPKKATPKKKDKQAEPVQDEDTSVKEEAVKEESKEQFA